MRPVLAGAELPQVQRITTSDVRAVAEHRPPGKDGSLLQNLGRAPTTITVHGVATDPGALDGLKVQLRAGAPVAFVADITTDSRIDDVVIDDLRMWQVAGNTDRFSYEVVLREHVAPVQPARTAGLDADLLDEAGGLLDALTAGLDLALPFATGLERFVGPLGDLLTRLTALNNPH